MTLKKQALRELDETVVHLRSLLRSRQSLNEAEQLFIENRLMILQIEYSVWAKTKLHEKRLPTSEAGRKLKDSSIKRAGSPGTNQP